jgi:hypothetical protein
VYPWVYKYPFLMIDGLGNNGEETEREEDYIEYIPSKVAFLFLCIMWKKEQKTRHMASSLCF